MKIESWEELTQWGAKYVFEELSLEEEDFLEALLIQQPLYDEVVTGLSMLTTKENLTNSKELLSFLAKKKTVGLVQLQQQFQKDKTIPFFQKNKNPKSSHLWDDTTG